MDVPRPEIRNKLNGMGNALFIYGCGLGSASAALGTLISRWMAAAIITILLLNPERKLHIEIYLKKVAVSMEI